MKENEKRMRQLDDVEMKEEENFEDMDEETRARLFEE